MLLAIDVGNTNTVFAIYGAETLKRSWRQRSLSGRTADEYALFINDALGLSDLMLKDISHVIISSVVPETHFQLERFCQKYLSLNPHFVSKKDINFTIDLPNPNEVGADRLVNALAVTHHYQTPAIIIDFGTATTFDVLDIDSGQPVYKGGVIAPGINLSMSALYEAASKLPQIQIAKTSKMIGKTTQHAMQSGVYNGYIGLISHIVSGISQEMSAQPFVLATGGLAALFMDDLPFIKEVDNELTLKGLSLIAKQNS